MISEAVKQLCVLSVFCGAALRLMPEGKVKSVGVTMCTCILLLAVLGQFKTADYSAYALESAKYREASARLNADAAEISERLNRLVIEQECATYIMNKAKSFDIELREVQVLAQWEPDGVWVPVQVRICTDCEDACWRWLTDFIKSDLGIEESCVVKVDG